MTSAVGGRVSAVLLLVSPRLAGHYIPKVQEFVLESNFDKIFLGDLSIVVSYF